jgi:haloacetate dehalogenase
MTSTTTRITTSRTTLNVQTSGQGVPLVMLHGWPQSSYCWEGTVPLMGDAFQLIRPDLRGLGDSERTVDVGDYCKNELAQDVLAALDAMDVKEFALVGHDWGGAVAQEVAVAAPDRVISLAVMNIHLINNPAGYAAADAVHAKQLHRAYWYQCFMQTPALSEAMVPGNEEVWLKTFLRGNNKGWKFPAEALDEYIRCYSIAGTATSGANYYRAMGMDAKRWTSLRGYVQPMPTLLLWGRNDPVVIPEFLTGYEDCFKDARVEEIDASHFLQEEQPEAVAAALRAHFEATAL